MKPSAAAIVVVVAATAVVSAAAAEKAAPAQPGELELTWAEQVAWEWQPQLGPLAALTWDPTRSFAWRTPRSIP